MLNVKKMFLLNRPGVFRLKYFPQRGGGGTPHFSHFFWPNKTLFGPPFESCFSPFWSIFSPLMGGKKTPFLDPLGEFFPGSNWRNVRKVGGGGLILPDL